MLQHHCATHLCERCVFKREDGKCLIGCNIPTLWEVPKPRRWTDADVLMAKAMYKYGWVSVMKPAGSNSPIFLVEDKDGNYEYGQIGFFKDLVPGERCNLADIVREAAND